MLKLPLLTFLGPGHRLSWSSPSNFKRETSIFIFIYWSNFKIQFRAHPLWQEQRIIYFLCQNFKRIQWIRYSPHQRCKQKPQSIWTKWIYHHLMTDTERPEWAWKKSMLSSAAKPVPSRSVRVPIEINNSRWTTKKRTRNKLAVEADMEIENVWNQMPLTKTQNIKAVRAVLWFVFCRRIRMLAAYDKRDINASVASCGDISRTSASLLNRTLRMLESSLSVPEMWPPFLIGTYVESLNEFPFEKKFSSSTFWSTSYNKSKITKKRRKKRPL